MNASAKPARHEPALSSRSNFQLILWNVIWLACLVLVHPGTAASPSVVQLPVRAGVTLPFLYFAAEKPERVALILLMGASGRVGIYPNGSMQADQAFLNRGASALAARGAAVALVDAPSDHSGGLYGFRDSPEHAADLGAMIAWLRDKGHAQVWLVGHSRGTESAVSAAIRLGSPPRGPDGLVLTAPVLRAMSFPGRQGKAVTEFAFDQIHVPTLVLLHETDQCGTSPPSELPVLRERLPESLPRKAVLTIAGGRAGRGGCDTESHHSFSGREDAALDTIIEFVLR
ncbi:MAG: alpha/beta hydrolase [Rubrivivax sp.]